MTTGSIIILTVFLPFVRLVNAVWKMKTQFIFSYTVHFSTPNVSVFLKISEQINVDVSIFPDEHFYYILVYGSMSNRLTRFKKKGCVAGSRLASKN